MDVDEAHSQLGEKDETCRSFVIVDPNCSVSANMHPQRHDPPPAVTLQPTEEPRGPVTTSGTRAVASED